MNYGILSTLTQNTVKVVFFFIIYARHNNSFFKHWQRTSVTLLLLLSSVYHCMRYPLRYSWLICFKFSEPYLIFFAAQACAISRLRYLCNWPCIAFSFVNPQHVYLPFRAIDYHSHRPETDFQQRYTINYLLEWKIIDRFYLYPFQIAGPHTTRVVSLDIANFVLFSKIRSICTYFIVTIQFEFLL